MRPEIKKLILLSGALLLFAVPTFAAEGTMSGMEEGQQKAKDVCLLVASATGCGGDVDTIQHRIDRLENEVRKGNDVYTNEELKFLNKKLEDERNTQEELYIGG